MEPKLLVRKIENGTVIDHIPVGKGFFILKILEIEPTAKVVVASNVDSKKYGNKDVIKIENRYLTTKETDIISAIAPNATINTIKNSQVNKKQSLKFPESIEEVLKCPNLSCVTNLANEPIKTKFINMKNYNAVQCSYCDSLIRYDELSSNLKS